MLKPPPAACIYIYMFLNYSISLLIFLHPCLPKVELVACSCSIFGLFVYRHAVVCRQLELVKKILED